MENRDGEIHVETDEARGASANNVVRWVLGIGLLLAIIGMSLAWIIPALSRGGETRNVNYTREVTSEARSDGSSTDSVITPEQANPDATGADTAVGSADGTAETGAQPTVENEAAAE